MAKHWTADDIPDLQAKVIVVTGGNSGIGYEAAEALAGKRANVVLAVRDEGKGIRAADRIRREHRAAAIEVMRLDLANLESIRHFASALRQAHPALSILINNAGVMAIPHRRTADDFEMQFGTNHLGHFALTGLLLPAILAAPHARVVTVSSINHMIGRIEFDDLNASRGYGRWSAYAQSKLANLLFAYELQRRFEQAGADAISVACHPGYAATNLQAAGPRMAGSRAREAFWRMAHLFAQSAEAGALPLLYAATAAGVKRGDYIGPRRLFGLRGHPGRAWSNRRSHDSAVARRLWQVSEELTGVHYEF